MNLNNLKVNLKGLVFSTRCNYGIYLKEVLKIMALCIKKWRLDVVANSGSLVKNKTIQ